MKIIVIEHVESEGPGSLGPFLESAGAETRTVRFYAGDRLPQDFRGIDAVISMGGPMNVYEEDRYPFLKEETAFLKRAMEAEVPALGICLGAQMIAKAAGALVTKSPKKEVGWSRVTLTDRGKEDPMFKGLPAALEVLQWHGDMFQVPAERDLAGGLHGLPSPGFPLQKRPRTAVPSRGD